MTSDDSKLLDDDVLKEIIEEFQSMSESQDGLITYSQINTFENFKEMEDDSKKFVINQIISLGIEIVEKSETVLEEEEEADDLDDEIDDDDEDDIDEKKIEEDIKKSAFNYTEGDVSILLAIGYPIDDTVREHKYYDRLANSDLVYIDSFDNPASDEDLEQRGLNSIFDYAKYAPSAYNSQPWRFLIEDDKLSIYIKDYAGDVNLIDAGIIMYYIDELGKTISSNSKWDIKPVVDGSEYSYIASKNL